MNANVYAAFHERVVSAPERRAITPTAGAPWTYGELHAEAGRLANLFLSLGVRPGDRIAVQVDKSPRVVATYLACFRAGAVFLPLNTAYTGAEVSYFLNDAEPHILLCDPGRRDALAPVAAEAGVAHVLTMDGKGTGTLADMAAPLADDAPIVERADDDVAAICYTSGTTGRSKGAMLTHRNLTSNALTLIDIWGFDSKDVLLHALPLFHVHGLFVATNTALLSGAEMIFLPRFDADEVAARLPEATVMMGVPTFYVRLLERADFTADACRSMRLFISGSAPLHTDTFTAFEERTGFRILERYGMTEAGMITSNPLDGPRRPGTVGPPLPDVSVRVADADGRVLAPGETGILEIRGPNLFKGYWRMPEKTAEEFRSDGYFITGDNALIDADGYVHIVGRAKDLIISGGYNVYPKEVEIVLDDLPGVRESAVFGVPHPDFGEAVAATVVPEPGAKADPEALMRDAREKLAAYKVPKRIFLVEELPRNTMGKVQKALLRERHNATFASGS